MNRLWMWSWILALVCVVDFWTAGGVFAQAAKSWSALPVPGFFEDHAPKRYGDHDGYAWYRAWVVIPEQWRDQPITLAVDLVDDAHQAFFNGQKIGSAGSFPPKYRSGLSVRRRYRVPTKNLVYGQANFLAIRLYDDQGRGGFQGAAPRLLTVTQAIDLAGKWQFRPGDDLSWARCNQDVRPPAEFLFSQVRDVDEPPTRSGGLSPQQAQGGFEVAAGLRWDQVLTEPEVAQPVFLNFDERGRMWVVQYRQYPHPAGLKMVSRDKYWRAVYDRVPQPPPHHTPGRDKITIHEDTDGDGTFDKHTTFVDGLNIVTAVEHGRGGVWVLNPPYLLFYPDADRNDQPDGPPEVHLSGFGLEDTHSVVNSLRWGPDGWLYAAQGSTVSGHVVVGGPLQKDDSRKPVHTLGQLIWRYHPQTRRYEVFAEGGGNAFGLEIDDAGRIFSGHNGGDTRGFHYVQGGYYRKGFSKHGPLSNPYAFGYFPPIKHHSVPRFTHNFILYGGGSLPEKYHNQLFGIEPLQGRVVLSSISELGSTFQTKDLGHPVTSRDRWFRPVDIKVGPDGGIYIADWYDGQVAHTRSYEGNFERSKGRIYRLQAQQAAGLSPFDLRDKSSQELVTTLKHPNRWFRQTALRLLADRQDAAAGPPLLAMLRQESGQAALEALWGLNAIDLLTESVAEEALGHKNPHVRTWAVRLICDDGRVSSRLAQQLVRLAQSEPQAIVRSQLACSAGRLPADSGLAIVGELLGRDEDQADPHLPLLLWWAVESHCRKDREGILALLEDRELWQRPLVQQTVLARLMRRFAQSGLREDLLRCARLLRLAPDDQGSQLLMVGFEQAFQGRPLTGLPDELVAAISAAGGGSLALQVRSKIPGALAEALKTIVDSKIDTSARLQLVQTLGEVHPQAALPVLLAQLEQSVEEDLKQSILTALRAYQGVAISQQILKLYPQMSARMQRVALATLGSRSSWTRHLLQAVDRGQIDRLSVPISVVRGLAVHKDKTIDALVLRLWGKIDSPTTAQMRQQIATYTQQLRQGPGDPYRGQPLYRQACANCHRLFGTGGRIGPDLTAYQRDDTENLLLHVVHPSAEIREGYENFLVLTEDGRTLTGLLIDRDNQVIVLRGADGQTVTIPRDGIEELGPVGQSLMPEGLLQSLSAQQVRDLFAYLRSSQPLNTN